MGGGSDVTMSVKKGDEKETPHASPSVAPMADVIVGAQVGGEMGGG